MSGVETSLTTEPGWSGQRYWRDGKGVLLSCAAVFLALSLDHLGVFPAVDEDEPWIAAAPYKLATQGVYGSDLFAGYYGVDRHNYQHLPLYPLLQAGLFRLIGVGVFEMRLLSVLFGLALICVVFLVGSRIADWRVGALAVVVMMVLRISTGGDATGILLLDRARINRYDIAVPVFALLAFWAFVRARDTDRPSWYIATGLLAALASLSHLFGVFWLPLFLALSVAMPHGAVAPARAAILVLSGFAFPWLPVLVYIASGWSDFLGQMRFVSERLEIFNPSFYSSNALHGPGPISVGWFVTVVGELPLARPGAWTVIVGIPVALLVIAWTARRDRGQYGWARLFALFSLAQLLMFVALLRVKTINYMIGLWPLAVLMLAWLGIWLWDRRKLSLRIATLVLFALILGEGSLRIVHAATAARRTASYERYTKLIARCIPPGSRVLGLQHYWLGLRQYDYRTWLVPINFTFPLYYSEAMPLDAALDTVNPDIILIDRYMARFFDTSRDPAHPSHGRRQAFNAFMLRRDARLVCTIPDATYGTMNVYRITNP
jgi:4-amino-4-deoxy-L-arabinose transferase-like glycosyltransferase